MNRVIGRVVVFTVQDTAAGTHALHVSRPDNRACSHAVAVFEAPGQDVADDFHVLMRVGTEPGATGHAVFVDNPQRPKAHVFGIVVASEGKRVVALQPAVVRVAPFTGTTNFNHDAPRNSGTRNNDGRKRPSFVVTYATPPVPVLTAPGFAAR